MTPTRRDILKGALAAGAVTSFNVGRLHAQESGAKGRIDPVLKRAVDGGEAPGVFAMAATEKGVLYEGGAGAGMAPDTVFRIASMTKAIATVAAMQLVEQGKLKLDDPVPNLDGALNTPQVLEGFDAAGQPKVRPAKRPITLKHLLTHTAGFTYDVWDANTGKYAKAMQTPHRSTGKVASLRTPLAFDPGERWLYGINIEWTGLLIERVSGQPVEEYFRDKIFGPLDMKDSTYVTTEAQRTRQARLHTRQADGSLAIQPLEPLTTKAEFFSCGGPLYSTPRDYLTFTRMLLNGGSFNGARILKPETVALMAQNHTGNIPCGVLKSEMKNLSYDVDLFPGQDLRWGLGYMLNLQAGPNGRSAGTLSWGGLFNTYYWIDPKKRVTGLIMTQILPFADPRVLKAYGELERGVYATIG
jgi:CubicO group peptidase (beta-lactamase class C family)